MPVQCDTRAHNRWVKMCVVPQAEVITIKNYYEDKNMQKWEFAKQQRL